MKAAAATEQHANPPEATEDGPSIADVCTGAPLKVVVAYEDLFAGRRAVSLLTKYVGDGVDLEPVLWRFDLLDHAHWYKMAVKDASDADILILSTGGSSDLPGAVNRWLKESVAAKCGGTMAMVVLCGADDAWAISIGDDSLADIGMLVQRPASAAETPPVGGSLPVGHG